MDNASRTPVTAPPTPAIASDEVDWTGQVLGQFRLLHRLGRGGMGQVYLAEQTNLKRKVALKLLNPELSANERALLRFKAEAENVARATHANIVQIYDIGKDNGVNWLALEYVEGKNLREFIEKKGTPELSLGLHIMVQVAAALQRASELGIIHRDIKPENILLTKKGDVKVADFGLSRCFAEEGQQTITQSQVTMGTPLYMSPEQVERKTVDTRTDIYSFGVTCYHMFAGTPPFRGTSPIEVAYQHVHKAPQPLAEIRPDLPADLCAIIQKMMAKRPEDRYQNAREIGRDIDRLREALNLGAVGAISISSSFLGSGSGALRGSNVVRFNEPPVRSPWLWRSAVAASVLMALGAGLLFGWVQHPRHQPIPKIAPPDEPALVKKPVLSKEDEKEMQRQVQKYLNPTNSTEVVTGLQHSVELGLYYLNEKRQDEAEQLFGELRKPERNPAYRFLGRLGNAMTLAFKDEPAASNQEFLDFFGKIERIEGRGIPIKAPKKDAVLVGEIEMYKHVWKPRDLAGHPDPKSMPMREMVARALNHNYANDPAPFAEGQAAEKLNAYRSPPRPTLKAAMP